MVALAVRTDQDELPSGVDLNRFKFNVEQQVLKRRGFTDVVNTAGEVAGNRDGCRVSIIHLPLARPRFWQVTVCMCDGGVPVPQAFDKAKATVDEVVTAINNIPFL